MARLISARRRPASLPDPLRRVAPEGAIVPTTGTVQRRCPMCDVAAATVRRSVDGWDLATCNACGFLYAPTIRGDTATELELADDYEPVWRARHRQIHRLLTGLLADGHTVVDVGAGFGELGLVTTRAGKLTYIGYEPSGSVAAAARRRGVDMRAEVFTPGTLTEAVGAVVLDNVIEHVADPVRLLSDCAESLSPGGALVVIVPNRHDIRQVVPRWRKANHWIPPEHINYFTAGSLRRSLERLGLTVQPFGFAALDWSDWKYWPRAAGERLGLFPFGINVYATKASPPDLPEGGRTTGLRERVVYRRVVGRRILGPVARWGYKRYLRTGSTPSAAYSALRKLYGNEDPRLFAELARGAASEVPLLDLPADPPGIAHGQVSSIVDSLRRDGYAVLDGRLDEATCADLERVARSASCRLVDGDGTSRAVFDETSPRAIRYEIEEADILALPSVQRFLADASLLAVAQAHLGAAPVQDMVTMWWSVALGRPASSLAAQQFHFDLDRLRFLKVFVYLTDVDDRSGPHTYVRGSHIAKPTRLRRDGRHSDQAVAAAYPGAEVQVVGPRGTVFLADTIGLHKGTEVEVGNRLIYQHQYAMSLYGWSYACPRIPDPSPELAEALRRYPDAFRRFQFCPPKTARPRRLRA